MAQIKTTFVDVTSIVPAEWFNSLQKHLAGFLNLKVTISGTTIVQVVAASSDDVASAYIGGEMRRNDTTVNHTFVAESADTYNVFVVATAAVDTFAVEVSTTVPATSPYRKVAEVDWSGSAITALRGVRGRIEDHGHTGATQPKVSHTDLTGGATGDPHTQYLLPDGSRALTGEVGGVNPTAANHLATKEYADSVLRTVPVGGVFWWPTADAAPAGFLLADGTAVSRTTYDKLFGIIGTIYGTGDGSTTFNIPDLRGRMIAGVTSQGNLGATAGSIDHTHTQPTHSHTQDAHTHTAAAAHDHTVGTSGSGGSHSHTQGVSGAGGSHNHLGANHYHSANSLQTAATGGGVPGARLATVDHSGLFPHVDLGASSSSTSHSHTDGTYYIVHASPDVKGYLNYTSKAHVHAVAGYAYEHTHGASATYGNVATSGASNTGTETDHTHTNPSTAAASTHTHAAGGNTVSASPGANSGGDVASAAGGGDVTGSATAPYLTVNAIIRYE
jgi:microcystin-dependent protein